MRMIIGRPGADAFELARPDLDHLHAGIVVKMRNNPLRHGFFPARRPPAARGP